jgi:hypothetical protein
MRRSTGVETTQSQLKKATSAAQNKIVAIDFFTMDSGCSGSVALARLSGIRKTP